MTFDKAFEKFPEIKTERLLLREIHQSDAMSFFQILSDEAVTRYYDDDTFTEVSQAENQITWWQRGYQSRTFLRWGITLKGEAELSGTCGFHGIHRRYQRAGIGYELRRDRWRQGIMTEALTPIIVFGYQELDLNRLEALVMPENAPSIKLLEKLGFRNEGLLRQYERWGSKGLVDVYLFSLLKKEWDI